MNDIYAISAAKTEFPERVQHSRCRPPPLGIRRRACRSQCRRPQLFWRRSQKRLAVTHRKASSRSIASRSSSPLCRSAWCTTQRTILAGIRLPWPPLTAATRSQAGAAILSFGAKGTTRNGGSSCSSITWMCLRPGRTTRSAPPQSTYNAHSNNVVVVPLGFLLSGGLALLLSTGSPPSEQVGEFMKPRDGGLRRGSQLVGGRLGAIEPEGRKTERRGTRHVPVI